MSEQTSNTPQRPDIEALRITNPESPGVLCFNATYLQQLVAYIEHLETLPATGATVKALQAEVERLNAVIAERLVEFVPLTPTDGSSTLTGDLAVDMAAYAMRKKDRAEAAEATLAKVRALADEWGELGRDVPTRDLRAVLDGAR